MYLGLMKIVKINAEIYAIDKIASEYNKKLQNDNELNQYLRSVNPTLSIPRESLFLKERYENEQYYPSELSSFLAYEQVLMGTLLAEYNGYIGRKIPTDLTPLYFSLKQVLHYLENFSESIEAETGYTLYNDNYFPLDHIDEALDILKQNPFIFPDKADSFNEYMFMHHPLFSVQPKASTNPSTEPSADLYTKTFKGLPQPAPKHQPSLGNAGQHSQEDQAGSPAEGQDPQVLQLSMPQAGQTGRKHYTVFVSSTFEDMRDIRAAVLGRLYSTEDFMPIGMENFMASNSSQLDYIRERLNDTDIYVLLLGGRYGTLTPRGDRSYTHEEYEMAKANPDVRVLSFVCKHPENLPAERRWRNDDEHDRLMEFTKEVESDKMVKTWAVDADPERIAGDVYQSLVDETKKGTMRGWTRGEWPEPEQ